MLSVTCLYIPPYTLNFGSKTKQISKKTVDANIDFILFLIPQSGKTPLI